MLVAPKKKSPPAPRAERDMLIRPLIDGALADALRYDAAVRGMKFEVELVRLLLTEHYRKVGWLEMGPDGDLAFRAPAPPAR
jgi:hypothetical protein